MVIQFMQFKIQSTIFFFNMAQSYIEFFLLSSIDPEDFFY